VTVVVVNIASATDGGSPIIATLMMPPFLCAIAGVADGTAVGAAEAAPAVDEVLVALVPPDDAAVLVLALAAAVVLVGLAPASAG